MTNWLFRHFIKSPDDLADRGVRAAYGTLGSVTGIIVNVLLATLKFVVGTLSGSLAATADAVNNLSDSAGSLMALITVRMAVKPNDDSHPFGHGRMEYLGALAVGVIILIAGGKLFYEGIKSAISPAALNVSLVLLSLMAASILVKFWLYFYYRRIARLINSKTLFAAAKDSLSDMLATGAVVISMLLQWIFGWRIDGYIGVVVALFVLKTGFDVCKDTIDSLLGGKSDPTLVRDIKRIMLQYDEISGLHDLILHDYGPGRCIASVHAEVSASGDIVAIHEVIDRAERDLKDQLGIEVCIHMDPTVTDDPKINALRKKISAFLKSQDERLSLHDFRVVPGEKQINLVFDCLLPNEEIDKEQLYTALQAFVKQLDQRYALVVQFDTDFT
ncbi:MAG TPA: cation diffusion facilitator family transporter [Candidatus Limiplasma sp.]|nr:cation diffusion facilitator family transporter [Candidatus Limiplasma sp.]HRX08905.1 cation diffusion facilitator family transporter [Candidatus Limiplasma sp.]